MCRRIDESILKIIRIFMILFMARSKKLLGGKILREIIFERLLAKYEWSQDYLRNEPSPNYSNNKSYDDLILIFCKLY